MWYVIQTRTGREELIKTLIEKSLPADVYDDCKIIMTERKKKYPAGWRLVKDYSFPGYVFIVSDHIEEVRLRLRSIPELTKLLGYGEDIVPINENEQRMLENLIDKDDLIEMSYCIQDGDRIVIREGPRKDQEFLICNVNRHKRIGYIQMELMGQVRKVQVGLEMVEKK